VQKREVARSLLFPHYFHEDLMELEEVVVVNIEQVYLAYLLNELLGLLVLQ
jgi:hypothetical protein